MIKKIKIPIYFGELIIIQKQSLKDIHKKWAIDFDFHGYAATCYTKNTKGGCLRIVIAFMDATTPEIITHESYHALNYLFEHNGIKHQFSNDEPAAFILGWIVKQCHKYLKVRKT
jgi:hypothetical protein